MAHVVVGAILTEKIGSQDVRVFFVRRLDRCLEFQYY